jgi:DNA-binding NtrC family response regulator
VDDEQSIREVAGKTLERFGYRVVQARNGAEAVIVYALRQEEISLVITDVSMPIMNGDALIVALRAINPGLRMLVSSGLPTSNAMAKAKNAGIQHFLPKPYSAESLLKALQQELSLPPLNERTRI